MASVSEIKKLIREVNITISKEDISDIVNLEGTLQNADTIEEFLIKNAAEIDFKQLLVLAVKRLQEVIERYKNVSRVLQESNQKELDKAIKLAKQYIKPDEIVKFIAMDYSQGLDKGDLKILNSKKIIYGAPLKNENPQYDKIKDIVPDIEVEEGRLLLDEILENKKFSQGIYATIIEGTLEQEGFTEQQIEDRYLQSESQAQKEEEILRKFCTRNRKERF